MAVKTSLKSLKLISTIFKFIILLVILGLFAYFGYVAVLLYLYKPVVSVQKIELKNAKGLEKIQSSNQYIDPVTSTEKSGRTNPLAPF